MQADVFVIHLQSQILLIIASKMKSYEGDDIDGIAIVEEPTIKINERTNGIKWAETVNENHESNCEILYAAECV